MSNNQIKFIKLLNKYGTLTAPQICKKLRIKKSSNYSTDYSEVCQYLQWPSEDGEFDSYINVKHYDDDIATSCRSEFSLNEKGKSYANTIYQKKNNIYNNTIAFIGIIIAFITLIISFITLIVSSI